MLLLHKTRKTGELKIERSMEHGPKSLLDQLSVAIEIGRGSIQVNAG